MQTWQMQEAKARLSEVVKRAYEDDFIAVMNQNTEVYEMQLRARPDDPSVLSTFLRFVQPSRMATENVFADAYIQPDYDTLKQYSSALTPSLDATVATNYSEAPGSTNLLNDPHAIGSDSNSYRQSVDLTNSRPKTFWAVYLSSAYQESFDRDNDKEWEEPGSTMGLTDTGSNNSLINVETLLDTWNTAKKKYMQDRVFGPKTLAEWTAMTVAHEMTHALLDSLQFGVFGHRDFKSAAVRLFDLDLTWVDRDE